jgi:hypothetical protein
MGVTAVTNSTDTPKSSTHRNIAAGDLITFFEDGETQHVAVLHVWGGLFLSNQTRSPGELTPIPSRVVVWDGTRGMFMAIDNPRQPTPWKRPEDIEVHQNGARSYADEFSRVCAEYLTA